MLPRVAAARQPWAKLWQPFGQTKCNLHPGCGDSCVVKEPGRRCSSRPFTVIADWLAQFQGEEMGGELGWEGRKRRTRYHRSHAGLAILTVQAAGPHNQDEGGRDQAIRPGIGVPGPRATLQGIPKQWFLTPLFSPLFTSSTSSGL
jgi:hypothetical protein